MKTSELVDVRSTVQDKQIKLLPPAPRLDDIRVGTCKPCGRSEMFFPGGHMGGVRD